MKNYSRLASLILAFVILTMAPAALADYLGGITFDKPIPSFLPHGEDVNISIDFKVDHTEGARIFARPYTLGSPTPGYGASGGPLVGPGTGTAEQHFTINYGNAVVTHIRVTMVSPDQSETYLELFVPVRFVFGPVGVFNIRTDRTEYSHLPYEKRLNIDFDYATNQTENVRIYARPFTNGSLTPGYLASGSISLPPAGSYDQYFFFEQDTDVTDIRFQVYRASDNLLLDEFFVPFNVHWREFGIYDITLDWPAGESMQIDQRLYVTFTVEHYLTETMRAWAWCTTGGSYSPGGAYQGSVAVPTGPQTISRYCFISSGEQHVDGIQLSFGTSTDIYMQFILPADFAYGPHAIQNVSFIPASPAIMSFDEHLNMNFDYLTSHTEDVLVFARPAFNEELIYGMTSSGSPYYPPPSGNGNYWVTYGSDHVEANSVYMFMRNADQTEDLLGIHKAGFFAWGPSGYFTPAPDEVPTAGPQLGDVYPNPFNPVATIPVNLHKQTHVELAIYDLKGRLVQTLHRGSLSAGPHQFTFKGDQEPSGVYFTRMKTPTGVQTRSMMLVK